MYFRDPDPAESCSLDDFLDAIRPHLPLDTEEKVQLCERPFRALGNAFPQLLADCAEAYFQRANDYHHRIVGPTLLIHQESRCLVRAVLWKKPQAQKRFEAMNTRTFAYDEVHNHNFDLMTMGVHGTGYETEVYRATHRSFTGFPQESLALEPVGRFRLGKGDLMYYERAFDFHAQHPPDAPSISLNILNSARDVTPSGQIIMNRAATHVAGLAEYRDTRVLKLAQMMIDADIPDCDAYLRELIARTEDEIVRNICKRKLQIHLSGPQRHGGPDTATLSDLDTGPEYDFAAGSAYDFVKPL